MKLSYITIDRTLEEGLAEDAGLRRVRRRHGMPMLSDGRKLFDTQLVEKLGTLGISIDRVGFEHMARPYLSAQEMSDALTKDPNTRLDEASHDHDWLWIALCCLWERWLPERPSFEMIDDQMQAGYDAVLDGDEAQASRVWCQTWRNILRIIDEHQLDGIAEFDDRFAGTQCVFNWLSDFEMALNNAGRNHPEFLQERNLFCRTFVQRFPDYDDLMNQNFKRSLADSQRQLGDNDGADALYSEWLREDPQWGWGWIGWSDDHYLFASEGQADPDRAVDLLREGLNVLGVRDRRDILERLRDLCDELACTEDVRAVEMELRELDEPETSRSRVFWQQEWRLSNPAGPTETWPLEKVTDGNTDDKLHSGARPAHRIGRNEPCPCGSGKKYKKCCMQRTK